MSAESERELDCQKHRVKKTIKKTGKSAPQGATFSMMGICAGCEDDETVKAGEACLSRSTGCKITRCVRVLVHFLLYADAR